MIAIFANSAGWNWIEPILTARNAPLTCCRSRAAAAVNRSASPASGDRVAVALERAVVAQEARSSRQKSSRPNTNHCACSRASSLVDPVDHHQPERGEHGDEREQVRVGVRQPRADEDVREHAAAEEEQPVGRRRVWASSVRVIRTAVKPP